MPREYILFSRLGHTDANFKNPHDAGRLDIVIECAKAAVFMSQAIRKDTVFHAILNGPPQPPVHLRIDGATLHDIRTDEQTWTQILRKILMGKPHPGITTDKTSFEALVKTKAPESTVYVLEEGGKDIQTIKLETNAVFILGDHIGLPKTVERFALRYGKKISLGKHAYLASSCITILNYHLDKQEEH